MIAACSGGAGDIVYSIPVMRKLGVTTYYIKKNFYHPPHSNLYETMKRFMESQEFECLPTSGTYYTGVFDPELKYDINVDRFREQRSRGKNHIITSMSKQFNADHPGYSPWLNIPGEKQDYTLINLTPRWRELSTVNWDKVLQSIDGRKYFIGFQYEWVEFCQRYGNIEWWPTEDVYDMACLIKGAKALYCNQSVALTIAQGLGVDYYLERKPGKTNTLIKTKQEHLL